MRPKKIYLNEEELNDNYTCERMVSCDAPIGNCNVEYTDLSQVWHDAKEMPNFGSAYIAIDNNNHICGFCKEQLIIGYSLWNDLVSFRKIDKWIYVADILPKGGDE